MHLCVGAREENFYLFSPYRYCERTWINNLSELNRCSLFANRFHTGEKAFYPYLQIILLIKTKVTALNKKNFYRVN